MDVRDTPKKRQRADGLESALKNRNVIVMASQKAKSVLVVDDESDIRSLVVECLEGTFDHITIEQAENGKVALEKVAKGNFDLIVTDIRMPEMDGIEFVRHVREVSKQGGPRGVIFLSGFIDQDSVARVLGNTDFSVSYVSKPFVMESLERLIERVLFDKVVDQGTIGPEFSEAFIDAAQRVLKATCGIEIEKEEIRIREKEDISGDISAIIGLNSSHFQGSLAIAFDEEAYRTALSNMLGTKVRDIETMSDGAAEICNQIFGIAKGTLNQLGHDIRQAIPQVITGKRHTIKHFVDAQCVAIRFKTKSGYLTVESTIRAMITRTDSSKAA